jgi:hypothetical protein
MNTDESISAMMNALRIDREQIEVYLAALNEMFIGEEEQ